MTTTIAYLNADEQRTPVTRTAPLPMSDATSDIPVGDFQSITDVSSATSLPAIPATARWALIQVETQSIRWRDDGVDPTSVLGHLLVAGSALPYAGNLAAWRGIDVTSGAQLTVSYYE